MCTFYADSGAALQAPLQALWATLGTSIPSDVNIQVANSGDIINDATGEITGTWTGAVMPPIAAGASAGYAAPVGIAMTWSTSGRFSGRLLRGRTFVVPTSIGVFDTDGSIVAGNLTEYRTAANVFQQAAAPGFRIWQRPKLGPRVTPGVPRAVIRVGGSGSVTSSSVADKAAVLRSRRD